MTHDRPPTGGLFRLRGPAQPLGVLGQQQGQPLAEERSEAREVIRHFVRVLERLDRDAQRKTRPSPLKSKPLRNKQPGSKPR